MALDLLAWVIKAIDRIRRNFLWQGRKEGKGGHCLLAWSNVTRPKEMGALGISDLWNLGWALRVRWPSLQKTDHLKPRSEFSIKVCCSAEIVCCSCSYKDWGWGQYPFLEGQVAGW